MAAGWRQAGRSVWTTAVALMCLLAPSAVRAQADVGGGAAALVASDVSVVWLVRHAERADDGMEAQPDPGLSEVGHARARDLARLLSDAGITAIYSSPFERTRQTAAPLAEALGLPVGEYDPRDADAMAQFRQRLHEPGRHLVVGHSNTTPALVTQLGGDAVSPIAELEYDRIYVLTIGADGSVTSTLLRFGAVTPGG